MAGNRRNTGPTEIVFVEPEAVRIRIAAEIGEMSVEKLYSLIKQGKVKTIRVGADQRVLLKELRQMLREGRAASGNLPPIPPGRSGRGLKTRKQIGR